MRIIWLSLFVVWFGMLVFSISGVPSERIGSWLFSRHEHPRESPTGESSEEKVVVVAVPGNVAWTDTGLEVKVGQEISFKATGSIILQVGNPDADCGPAGYNLKTVQQPIQEENLGALIGKVVISVRVIIDDETGEERKEEAAQIFFVGAEKKVEMSAEGRLFLGINDNVIGDNAGQFLVTIVTKG